MRAGVIGGVSVNFSCLCQTDIKALIAYSLVAHMVLVLCGLILFSWWGLGDCFCNNGAWGLCSSGLFCLANIAYERVGGQSLLVRKG